MQVAKNILAKGPKHLIVKRGEYGVLLFNRQHVFGAPAFPLERFKIPQEPAILLPVDLWDIWPPREPLTERRSGRPSSSGVLWPRLP